MENTDSSEKPKPFEICISVLVSIYFFYVLVWLCPASVVRTKLITPIYNPWLYFGLNQSWSLFSPTIREINYYPSAIITFEDGSKTLWEPPLMDRLDLVERFQKEKFRKWSIDSLPWSKYKYHWEDFARFIGRKYYDPVNKPVSISLNLRWTEIPKPIEPIVSQSKLPAKTKFNTNFCYMYKPEDFQ